MGELNGQRSVSDDRHEKKKPILSVNKSVFIFKITSTLRGEDIILRLTMNSLKSVAKTNFFLQTYDNCGVTIINDV